jgi:outer membrane lipoprotein SlyB
LPWGENEEEAKEASARGELSLVLLKRAMRKAAELPSSKGMLDMSSFGGGMADYLTPGSWGGERAGRAQALASAVGEDTPFSVRHPTTTDMLGAAGGAALGAGIGGLAGGFGHGGEGAMTAGGIGGGLLGALLTAFIRRRNMKKIVEKYEGKRHGVDPEDVERPDLESASALLLPGRGPHRTGQTETVRAMKGEDSIGKQHTGGRDALYTAAMLPYVGGLIGLGHGYGQNITTHTKGKEDKAFDRRLRGMKLRDGDGDGKVNDGTPEEREVNKEEAKAASARGVLSPVLLQRAMEKQSDLQDIIKGTGEAVKSTGEAVSGYWSRYVNALKGGTIVDQLVNPEKAKLHQLLAMAGTGALGGGALGMLNESRKKKEDRDLLGGGMFGGALGGLGGLGAWAANPVGQWQYKDGASIR